MTNYECPKCRSKNPVTVRDRVLCVRCGSEMRPVLLYSEIIWPSLKESIKKQMSYNVEELERSGKLISELETKNLPTIASKEVTLKIPKIQCSNIYELKDQLEMLEKDLLRQIKDKLGLSNVLEEIHDREIYMATFSRYIKSSDHPAKQYSMTIEYLRRKIGNKDDKVLESILAKMENEKEEYEKKWKYRNPVCV